jgi:hypothetical protein
MGCCQATNSHPSIAAILAREFDADPADTVESADVGFGGGVGIQNAVCDELSRIEEGKKD